MMGVSTLHHFTTEAHRRGRAFPVLVKGGSWWGLPCRRIREDDCPIILSNHSCFPPIPSGKQTVSYWTWPSRNSWFTHRKCMVDLSIVFFGYVYQRVIPMNYRYNFHEPGRVIYIWPHFVEVRLAYSWQSREHLGIQLDLCIRWGPGGPVQHIPGLVNMGKHTKKNDGKIHHAFYSWVNPPFRLGHFR